MFFGDDTFNIITEKENTPIVEVTDPVTNEVIKEGGLPTNRWRKDVACFHTFMLMNLFNMINCRVV